MTWQDWPCVPPRVKLGSAGYGDHRRAYESVHGPVPEGLEIDHLCRNRWCRQVHHMEAVTHAENQRRSGILITHCVNGHEFTPENTYIRPAGQRSCRACNKERQRAWRERQARLIDPPTESEN